MTPAAAPLPVVLVTSRDEDPAVLGEAVRAAVDDLLAAEDRSLALEELAGDELTPSSIVDACQTPPFLTGRRVVVVRDVGRWSAEELQPLVAYLADPSPTASLVLVAGGGRLPTALTKAVGAKGRVVDASVPSGKGRSTWLAEHVRAASVKLDAAAVARIGEHLGEDVGRLPSLLDALAERYGEGASLGVEEVEPFLGAAGAVAPWDLTDAIDRGDTEVALVALRRLMGAGDRHALGVLSLLHRHFASMLRLDGAGIGSEADAAALLGVKPYPAAKAMRAAARLGSAGVARAMTLLADADLDLRGVRDLPPELVMEILVARLSRLAPRAAPAAGGRSSRPAARAGGARRGASGRS